MFIVVDEILYYLKSNYSYFTEEKQPYLIINYKILKH
jgi:hypothetical protein